MIGWRRISDTLRAERTSHSIMPGNENNARPKKSAYLSLYEKIREGILTGDYPYGSRLPSKRTLAADAGVSVITASHALLLLAEEGYIEGRERSGSFVIYEGAGQGAAPEKGPERKDPGASGTIHAADIPSSDDTPVSTDSAVTLSPTDFFPFSLYARTIRRVLSDRGEDILKRGPNQGVPELRGAISRYLARNRGIHVLPEQILIGSGAEYLYGLIVQMLGRDTVFGLEDPSYEKIRLVYEANGA
ncbi:MAG: GntR family transcriptional regulator, partial [Lachnospiraceae bacterium]|nr:GntR family transcriptional regulator [Lachnospiraceae bacterium]